MNRPESPAVTPAPVTFEPKRPGLLAAAILIVAALTLCWPMLTGQLINGSDYYLAGWGFRHFGEEYFRQHHAIPLWNPYIFGGMPYVAGMHGDIFYPTAWLRWILPLGAATNLTFGGHIVIAGLSMYAFLRGLKLSWTAAVTGGLAYELSGIVASMVSPGHDGKLFVAAVAPLLLLGLLQGIREGKVWGYGLAALGTGLAMHGHPQTGYYLLVAAAIWGIYLLFWDDQAPRGAARYRALGWSALAAGLGIGLYAIQLLPLIGYLPYSPRGAGGPSGGWEYAQGFAMPPAEIFTTFYPQLNGMKEAYAGGNLFKLHSEHLGVVVLLLALCGLGRWGGAGAGGRRRERWALGVIGFLFLLVAFGGHTPFYRLWYEIMPTQKSVRAVGSAFYLVALPVCALAGYGAQRLLSLQMTGRRVWIGTAIFAALGLLGAAGALEGLAESLAAPQLVQLAAQNAPEIRAGGLRLLVFAVAGGVVLYGILRSQLRGAAAAGALFLAVGADLWSIDRHFFEYGNAEQMFGSDDLTRVMEKAPVPYRVWDPRDPFRELEVYPGSWLMGRDVPQLLGYHGNELRNFDELFGEKNNWTRQTDLRLLELFAVRFVVLSQTQDLPRFHQVAGPVATRTGSRGLLYEADTVPPYVRLMAGAVKAPDSQVAEIVTNPRFPVLEVAVYADSERVSPADLGGQVPAAAAATARVSSWEPGAMRIAIEGRDERPLYLVVAENWYKDWRATVDGRDAPVLRAQHTMLSVVVPPGAKEVALTVQSSDYRKGRLVTLVSLVVTLSLLAWPLYRRRTSANA